MASPYGLHKMNRPELDALATAITLQHPATESKAELKDMIEQFLHNRSKELHFKRIHITIRRGRSHESFSAKMRMGNTTGSLKVLIQAREGTTADIQDLTIDGLRCEDATTLADCSADERNVVCKSMEMPFPIGVTLVSGRRIVANVRSYTRMRCWKHQQRLLKVLFRP